jgi:hypothetical protein
VASFVAICVGFLGIPVNWDLWVHLFSGELHTLATGERGTRRAVRTGGLMLVLRDTCKELYLQCTMMSNNADWEKGWFYLRNDGPGLPSYTGRVLREKSDAWVYGVSPPYEEKEARASHRHPAPVGRFWAGGGIRHRQLPPPVDHPSHGEGAPHL